MNWSLDKDWRVTRLLCADPTTVTDRAWNLLRTARRLTPPRIIDAHDSRMHHNAPVCGGPSCGSNH
jgi:hypothetical protein